MNGTTDGRFLDDPRFTQWTKDDQFTQREAVNELVVEHMAGRTIAEWEQTFAKHGVWCVRVRDYDEVLADPQIAANQSILTYQDPTAGEVRVLAHPVRYDGKAPGIDRPPPSVGQHTGEVVRELGFDEAELERLRETGAVGPDRAKTGFDRAASAPASSYSKKSPERAS